MEQQFNATLTGTDGPVNGIIQHVTHSGYKNAYQFDAIDDTLHLVIAPDQNGNWHKIAGTEPYLLVGLMKWPNKLRNCTPNNIYE
ncbi:hypothetical protein HK413_11905 [Mucilaginibacter sp. S1162]|uniref:DUF3892 domain-containing protein n=1 Tax=Mucilaginibacter humi TaxID=2732510 RepID=A0ABX1W4Q7_9SPHI|nr:hypothetical protein [Mucilaginibacter humi]NNU34608.1 hypothetical protein [Mucilaginibacter humi]